MSDKSDPLRGWIAICISVLALLASGYGAFRAYQTQEKTNNVAQKSERVAEENNALQKEIQQQNQVARERAAAESVAIATVPPQVVAGQPAQGIIVSNGAKETIANVEVVFTIAPTGYISAVSSIPTVTSCQTVELDFTSSYSPSVNWDAWLYFKDADGNIWLTDLYGSLSEVNQEPTGTDVSNELQSVPGTMPVGTCI